MGSVGRFSVKLRADTDRFRTFRRQTKMRYPSRSRQPTATPTMTKRGRRSSPRGTRLYSRPRSRPGRKPGTILLSALTSDRRTQPGHCSPEPGAECLCAAPPANARSQFHRRLRRALGATTTTSQRDFEVEPILTIAYDPSGALFSSSGTVWQQLLGSPQIALQIAFENRSSNILNKSSSQWTIGPY